MKLEVLSTETREFTIEGRQYRQQTGWAHLRGEPYPREVRFTVDKPYPPGDYILDVEASVSVRNNKMQLGRLRLVPAPASATAAAAK